MDITIDECVKFSQGFDHLKNYCREYFVLVTLGKEVIKLRKKVSRLEQEISHWEEASGRTR